MSEATKFVVGAYYEEHPISDADCKTCLKGYPKPCDCGGLVHASFGDEASDCIYWIYTKCDKCGDEE